MSQHEKPPPESTLADRLTMPVITSLTLGLAPFAPEPHIIGKLRWVAGGAVDMGLVDWGDLAMHGAPWLWLMAELVGIAVRAIRPSAPPASSS